MQENLIKEKDVKLDAVQKTVEAEMKSYSSVVQKTCTAALAPRKLAAAVKTVSREDDRSKNVVIFGVEEGKGESVDCKVRNVLDQLEEKPVIVSCSRIGQSNSDSEINLIKRPIRLRLKSSDMVHQLLTKAKMLKDIDGFKSVYISPDRTIEERASRRELVSQLKDKRLTDSKQRHFIRKGKIVSETVTEE